MTSVQDFFQILFLGSFSEGGGGGIFAPRRPK